MIKSHLTTLSNFLDLQSSKYEEMLILVHFNVGIDEPHMQSICETYDLTNLIYSQYANPLRTLSWSLLTCHVHFKTLV